jgi:prefoldin subunit 5
MKGKKMSNVLDMAEAHLLNVQREVQNLNQRKQEIDQEIEKLTEYLDEGVQVVNTAKSEANAALAGPTETPEQDDDRPF